MRTRQPMTVALLLVLALLLGACAGTQDGAAPDSQASPPVTASSAAATAEATPTPTPTPVPTPPTEPAPSTTPPAPALESRGVASGHPLASRAGMEVLEQGGNAVDAAVATAFADAVLTPSASGIGGGGVALVASGGEATHYEYRDVVDQSGDVPDDGVGVPGFVAGMGRLHADHGSLPWADLLEPAIRLAREGVPVSGFLAGAIATGSGQRATGDLPQFRRESGGSLGEGDLLVQEDLAETMGVIAQDGPAAVYTGALVPALAEVPGLDAESLAAYEVAVAAPAEGPVGEYTMLSAAPPLVGAAVIQMLQIAEAGGVASTDPGSAAFVDLQTRAWRVAESSVQEAIGDPAFVDVPVAELTDPARNAAIAAELDGAPQALGAGSPGTSAENTTHISVVDAEGRAVSMTNTITNYWGSGRDVLGFFVNDSLERFDEIGDEDTNAPAPGRRSVTWSAPTILLDDESRPVLVLGTPGGQQIPNIVASVVTRWALHGEGLDEVVPADRFFYGDGVLNMESSELTDPLTELGWTVQVLPESDRTRFGSVQALAVDWDTGQVSGVADTRRSAGVETSPR